jgi:hypothetical protein
MALDKCGKGGVYLGLVLYFFVKSHERIKVASVRINISVADQPSLAQTHWPDLLPSTASQQPHAYCTFQSRSVVHGSLVTTLGSGNHRLGRDQQREM